jgi:cytochrome c oxidase assembly protein subunit 15
VEASHSERFARYGWGVLAFNLLVILWGAYVRASGSGAGCGAHWPLCNGVVIPREPAIETIIELTHRLTSGIALILVVVQLAWARRLFGPGDPARRAAHWAMALMLTEALVGAGLVLFEMVAQNESIARAWWLAAHLLNTFLLVAALTLVPWFAGGAPPPLLRHIGAEGRLLLASCIAMLFLGMTGAIAALGDTLYPSATLAEGIAQDFAPTASLLVRLRIIHPTLAVLTAALLALTAAVCAQRRPSHAVKRLALTLGVLTGAQLVAGLMNLVLLAPVAMQLLHLLLADLIWITLVLLGAAALATVSAWPPPSPEGASAAERARAA